MQHSYSIPPLLSGGIMLSYRCTNACRHCLYWCSPKQPDEWMTEEMARKVFGALQKEPRLQSIHFAGGEATLRPDLLEKLISMAAEMEIFKSSNASFTILT